MKIKTLLTVTVIAFAAILILNGCKKQQPLAPQEPSEQDQAATMEDMPMEGDTAAADETIVQKICPIMGKPIKKDVFVEYEGKKVYFCCPGCEGEFEKDPEKYISKLPQFQE